MTAQKVVMKVKENMDNKEGTDSSGVSRKSPSILLHHLESQSAKAPVEM